MQDLALSLTLSHSKTWNLQIQRVASGPWYPRGGVRAAARAPNHASMFCTIVARFWVEILTNENCTRFNPSRPGMLYNQGRARWMSFQCAMGIHNRGAEVADLACYAGALAHKIMT